MNHEPNSDNRPWCAKCAYGEPVHMPEGMLRCRRHAPRPAPGGVSPEAIAWPIVSPDDWCGEHLLAGTLDESEDPLSSFTRG